MADAERVGASANAPAEKLIIRSLATRNDRAVMPFGFMGGQYQPVGQTHVLTNMLDDGCDVQEAIDMPRSLRYEGVYQLEDSVPADLVEGLRKFGHKTTSVVGPLGRGQAIWIDWDKGTLAGGSDPRKDGCALGPRRSLPIRFDSIGTRPIALR